MGMERIPEPELMDEAEQAKAYAEADFAEPHSRLVNLCREFLAGHEVNGYVLDLGCGPGDVSIRFARAFPACRLHGVDGSEAMLAEGERLLAGATDLAGRVSLYKGYLPGAVLPRESYDMVFSNSLLHHLHDPQVLWRSVRRWAAPGAAVFIADLMRTESPAEAARFVELYAANEPEILKKDFYNSLLAAFTPAEIETQLARAGLNGLAVSVVSDRHLVIAGYNL